MGSRATGAMLVTPASFVTEACTEASAKPALTASRLSSSPLVFFTLKYPAAEVTPGRVAAT